MKKAITTLMALTAMSVGAVSAFGQNDTTLVKSPIKWEQTTEQSKSGEDKLTYYAVIDGERFVSNKSSVERYRKISRYGGTPCVVRITNRKSKATRVITL